MNEPVFILGSPRSGTTFLASLLQKTKYGPPFETHFIVKYYKKLEKYGDLGRFSNFNKLLNDILQERVVMQWKLDFDHKELFESLQGKISYEGLINKLCLLYSNKNGFSSWGDKTPDYIDDLETIDKLFPNTKYLYIIRDGRDVALSLHKRDWGPNNVYYSALDWRQLNRDQDIINQLTDSGRLLSLKYEDLLRDTEAHIDKIYQFLGENLSRESRSTLSKQVVKGNFYKWKKNMSHRQIEIFDSIAASTLSKFGYETSTQEKSISKLIVLFYLIHQLIFRFRHLFIINVIDTIKIRYFGKEPFAE